MIKFDSRLLKGKSIERLDEWYFKLNPTTDEIELTPFAEDKIAKAMKTFYGNALKTLSLGANDLTYISKSKELKQIKDEDASLKAKEFYDAKYSKELPEINELLENLMKDYKDSHPDEFEDVEVLDNASYFDGENYKSSGGNLYDLKCTSIKEAAIGYQTASAFLKDNPLDKTNAPTKIEKRAKDKKAWEDAVQKMREQILAKPEYNHLPDDIFKPVVYKEDYSYSINWRVTQKESEDDKMLTEAANAYIASMV